jgi:hypothetical protein
MSQEDQVFVANVVVTYLMQKKVALNVITQPTSVVAELNAIVKIHKYRGLHEGHHFILMAVEVHDTLGCDMDCFIKKCACHFHDKRLRGRLSLSFCIQFFRQCVNIDFQCALTSAIERKIVLVDDVCFRPPITIKSHDLHVGDIRGVVGDITSYHERD